jgi:hypothetical protein
VTAKVTVLPAAPEAPTRSRRGDAAFRSMAHWQGPGQRGVPRLHRRPRRRAFQSRPLSGSVPVNATEESSEDRDGRY